MPAAIDLQEPISVKIACHLWAKGPYSFWARIFNLSTHSISVERREDATKDRVNPIGASTTWMSICLILPLRRALPFVASSVSSCSTFLRKEQWQCPNSAHRTSNATSCKCVSIIDSTNLTYQLSELDPKCLVSYESTENTREE